jgi:hypothetical protein
MSPIFEIPEIFTLSGQKLDSETDFSVPELGGNNCSAGGGTGNNCSSGSGRAEEVTGIAE